MRCAAVAGGPLRPETARGRHRGHRRTRRSGHGRRRRRVRGGSGSVGISGAEAGPHPAGHCCLENARALVRVCASASMRVRPFVRASVCCVRSHARMRKRMLRAEMYFCLFMTNFLTICHTHIFVYVNAGQSEELRL